MDFYTIREQWCKGKGLDEYILNALLSNPIIRALGEFDDIEFRTDKDFVTVTFKWYNIIKI